MSGASQRGATATIRIIWPAIALLVLLVAAVETAVAAGLVSALILPRPSEVVIALIDQFAEARIWEHIAATAFETVAGFGIEAGSPSSSRCWRRCRACCVAPCRLTWLRCR